MPLTLPWLSIPIRCRPPGAVPKPTGALAIMKKPGRNFAHSGAGSEEFAGSRIPEPTRHRFFPMGRSGKPRAAADCGRPARRGRCLRATCGNILRAGDLERAYGAMQDCLARDPYNFQTHCQSWRIVASTEEVGRSAATPGIREAIFPRRRRGNYTLLYEVDKALGDPRAAADAVRFGLRMFPDNSELQRLNLLP